MKKISIFPFLLMIIISCKFVRFGEPSWKLDKNIPFKRGSIHFKKEDLYLKFLITSVGVKEDPSNDLIIFMHGLGKTELEWVEEDGFGRHYYDVLKSNPGFKNNPVVSISLGATYLLIDNAPEPYKADLEKLFLYTIIPYFKKSLNCNGNVYLFGHSMGGYNVLSVSLRHPDRFPTIVAISPYVAPISPFNKKFKEKGEELRMNNYLINYLEKMLTVAFKTEDNWNNYSPFVLVEKNEEKNFPYIIISDAKNDLPGFEWSIDAFTKIMEERKIEHFYCKTSGNHNATCQEVFRKFLERISKKL